MNFQEYIDLHGKRCPACHSGQITTLNNEHPLRHRCLDCKREFMDDEAWIKSRDEKNRRSGNQSGHGRCNDV